MARWEPNAQDRLQEAAMELFRIRGYAGTTVQDIAERAGLTERTFFRYFTDKREVLFSGGDALKKLVVDALKQAPKSVAPLDAVVGAYEATGPMFEERRAFAKARQALIVAHPELLERELVKLTMISNAVAEALRARGVASAPSTLAAEAGTAVFRVAFEAWVSDAKARTLSHHLHAAVDALRTVTKRAK